MLYQKLKMSVTKISQPLAYLAGVLAINLLAPLSASAATVNGSVTLATSFGFVIESGVEAGVDFIDFASGATNPSPSFDNDISTALVTSIAGDFVTAGITPGTSVDVKDFRFDLVGIDNPILIGSVFTFSITDIIPPSETGTGAGDFSGEGILIDTTGTFDPTIYDFTFNNINGDLALITNTAVGNPIPVPGAVWLFGSALAGMLVARRKRG